LHHQQKFNSDAKLGHKSYKFKEHCLVLLHSIQIARGQSLCYFVNGDFFRKQGISLLPVVQSAFKYRKTRNILDCDQSNYSSRIILSHIPKTLLS